MAPRKKGVTMTLHNLQLELKKGPDGSVMNSVTDLPTQSSGITSGEAGGRDEWRGFGDRRGDRGGDRGGDRMVERGDRGGDRGDRMVMDRDRERGERADDYGDRGRNREGVFGEKPIDDDFVWRSSKTTSFSPSSAVDRDNIYNREGGGDIERRSGAGPGGGEMDRRGMRLEEPPEGMWTRAAAPSGSGGGLGGRRDEGGGGFGRRDNNNNTDGGFSGKWDEDVDFSILRAERSSAANTMSSSTSNIGSSGKYVPPAARESENIWGRRDGLGGGNDTRGEEVWRSARDSGPSRTSERSSEWSNKIKEMKERMLARERGEVFVPTVVVQQQQQQQQQQQSQITKENEKKESEGKNEIPVIQRPVVKSGSSSIIYLSKPVSETAVAKSVASQSPPGSGDEGSKKELTVKTEALHAAKSSQVQTTPSETPNNIKSPPLSERSNEPLVVKPLAPAIVRTPAAPGSKFIPSRMQAAAKAQSSNTTSSSSRNYSAGVSDISRIVAERTTSQAPAPSQKHASDESEVKIAYKKKQQEREKQKKEEEEKRRLEKIEEERRDMELLAALVDRNSETVKLIESEVSAVLSDSSLSGGNGILNKLKPQLSEEDLRSLIPSVVVTKTLIKAITDELESFCGSNSTQKCSDDVAIGIVRTSVDKVKPLLNYVLSESRIRRHKLKLLYEIQRMVTALDFPRLSSSLTLIESIWDTLYMLDIIEEQYFIMWYDDFEDKTEGRKDVIFQMFAWFDWLRSASSVLPQEAPEEDDEADEEYFLMA